MQRGTYHVSGVAGVGMSALAELLLGLGHEVSGSDRTHDQGQSLPVLDVLVRQGLTLFPQDGCAPRPGTAALLVSTAIEESNPEVATARRLGIPVVHRAEMLVRLAEGRRVVAIAGTAGKTTVTALTGWLLEQAGLDPTVVNGGVILNWASPERVGNVRIGRSDLFVLEVDESDKSLLRFRPDAAVILNVSKDHYELDEVISIFRQFAGQVARPVILGHGVGALLGLQGGEAPTEFRTKDGVWSFTHGGLEFEVPLMIGRHNAENAFMAIRLCESLGAPLSALRDALRGFRGVGRRLEVAGAPRGIRVIDDYAHNPAKIAASWRAVAETSPRVLGFWRPHGFKPLSLMKDELAASLAATLRPCDRFFVLPVFYAGGTAARTIDSESWVTELKACGVPATFVPDYDALRAELLSLATHGDAILGMGARDPGLPPFARDLVRALA